MADTSITIGDKELLELLLASKSLHQSAIRLENELADLEERIDAMERVQAQTAIKLRTNPDTTLHPHSLSLRLSLIDGQIAAMIDSSKGIRMWLAAVSTGLVIALGTAIIQNVRWGGAPAKAAIYQSGRMALFTNYSRNALLQTIPKYLGPDS